MSSHNKVPSTKEEVSLQWLNTVLNSQGINVIAFKWTGEVNDGSGVLSSIERLQLQVSDFNANEYPTPESQQTLSLIVKTLPNDSDMLQFAVSSQFCLREVKMYTQVFPEIDKFIQKQGGSPNNLFRHPKCYYGADEGQTIEDYKFILLLEDMHSSNFQTWNGGKGQAKDLKMEQAKAVVLQIARLHGLTLSYKVANNISRLPLKYDFLMDISGASAEDTMIVKYITDGFKDVFTAFEDGDESLPIELIEQLKILSEKPFEVIRALFPDNGKHFCIRHVDLHSNNLMFKQEKDGSIEANLLDFQACAYGAPMADLAFFLFLTCDPSIPTNHLSEVLTFYHQVFTDVTKEMKVSINYSLEDMTKDFELSALGAILHIISGATGWCFGPGTGRETKRRFKSALLLAFQKGWLQYPRTSG